MLFWSNISNIPSQADFQAILNLNCIKFSPNILRRTWNIFVKSFNAKIQDARYHISTEASEFILKQLTHKAYDSSPYKWIILQQFLTSVPN